MDTTLIGVTGLLILPFLLASGIHIGVALAVIGAGGIICVVGFNRGLFMLASSFYSIGDRFVWIVIPLFVFMGVVAAKGGITRDLYNGLSLWCGKLRAGLGIATVFGCAGFGTVCGASLVVASVFGKVSAPEMRRHGDSKTLAYGICAAAGMD